MNDHELMRNEITEQITKDLFGPYFGDDEIIDEPPNKRYLTGVLYPNESDLEPENDQATGLDSFTKYDDSDPGLALTNARYPSCYGFTFLTDINCTKFNLLILAGEYENPKDSQSNWKRRGIRWSEDLIVSLEKTINQKDILDGLQLRIYLKKISDSVKSVTISLINTHPKPKNQTEKSKKCFYQIQIQVTGIDCSHPFLPRSYPVPSPSDEESQLVNLLYREVNSYAVGHGCSVTWSNVKGENAGLLSTDFLPKQYVYQLVPNDKIALPEYNIKKISQLSYTEIESLFGPLCQEYRDWLDTQTEIINNLDDNQKKIAQQNIDKCKITADRIRKGIDLLKQDKLAFIAFKYAHEAMLFHFAHSKCKKDNWNISPSYSDEHKWYPFQISFILQCIESIGNPESADRELVDLLWFPTGGGKTEAYLGLTAFVLFLRRLRSQLRKDKGGGTAVITRYTLRLLTVDQFNRTSMMVCACEKIRNERMDLKNSEPISIGLWVGNATTPNRLDVAKKSLKKIQEGIRVEPNERPDIVTECPWCGKEIGAADYLIDGNLKIRCPDNRCYFRDGLPLYIIDDDIYEKKPSIIIGTVDKFARLPWLKESGFIFGTEEADKPPELIIQDELHLISGPLGSMVGLYEIVVEALCKNKKSSPPKIISSTATIRNAEKQARALYNRDVAIFPQPAVKYSDSFFAYEEKLKPARQYLGILAPGLSATTSLVRTFASILHRVSIADYDNSIKDPYWTLTGYFNSLRELGGAHRQVYDDVIEYMEFCGKRDGLSKDQIRKIKNVIELTSRATAEELKDYKNQLWANYPAEECVDVVLATNMISVGLDVPRLGLMAIIGQPKSTSEYIQASSRIGRQYPGLVLTIYNINRSRDRSHYENFNSYHMKFYGEVEATSVTPFSSRARDRGLHGIIIGALRHLVPYLQDNDHANKFEDSEEIVKKFIKDLITRIEKIDPLEIENSTNEIEAIINKWKRKSQMEFLKYSTSDNIESLLVPAEELNAPDSFRTLNSLRNVDQSINLKLKI